MEGSSKMNVKSSKNANSFIFSNDFINFLANVSCDFRQLVFPIYISKDIFSLKTRK